MLKDVALPIGLVLALAGCENLYIASETVIGLNASLNAPRTSGSLSLAYERDFVTIIPRSVETAGDDGDGKEAMAAISCTDFETDGIFITRFEEQLATGRAAINLANALNEDNSDELFRLNCLGSRLEQDR